MPYLFVRHKVADFDQWQQVFDSHLTAQEESGLKVQHVVRNLEDPNEVVLWFEVTDLVKAREFVTAPAAEEAADQSGVIDTPDWYFLG